MGDIIICLLYGLCSTLMNITSKTLISVYHVSPFYSLLLIQYSFITLISLKKKYVVSWGEAVECSKISVLSASNILFGAIGMKYVNLPMYIALRKLCTAKIYLIDIFVYKRAASISSTLGVLFISLGAVVAGFNDFTSDLTGYIVVFGSNLMNAMLLIQIKAAKDKYDSLESLKQAYICSVISVPYITVLMYTFNELELVGMSPYADTWELYWVILIAGILGIACNITLFKAANEISPMATSVVGNAKDFISIFIGYVAFGDVNGNFLFVSGLCFSMIGAGVYSIGKLNEIRKISV